MKQQIKKIIANLVDIPFAIVTIASAIWLKVIRKIGVHRMRMSKWIFMKVGVFPIQNHYYEPLFNTSNLSKSLRDDRSLPGINFNVQEQLQILNKFHFSDELKQFPLEKKEGEFYYHNDSFLSGDAEYLYNMIRFYKPTKLIEIGGVIQH